MNRLLLAACAALVIGCLVYEWSSVTKAQSEHARAVAAEAEARAQAEARLAEVSRSTAVEKPDVESPSERVAVPRGDSSTAELQAIAARLESLEAAVRQLQDQAKGRPALETYDTPESMEQALRGLAGMPGEREQRIALLERFLELFPNHAKAPDMLEALIAEQLGSQSAAALVSLERYGSRVIVDPSRLDGLRANVLIQNRRYDEGRAAYERVLRAAPDAVASADASFWIAHSYMQEGRYDDAQSRFETLLARYGDDPSPEMASIVAGAKNQLKLIAEYRVKK